MNDVISKDNSPPRILYPEKLAIVIEGKRKSWPLSQLHRECLKKYFRLNRKTSTSMRLQKRINHARTVVESRRT